MRGRIAVSGLGANQAEAQTEVLVGMGLLAGSSVMVLTALWGSCLIFGRCDLVNGVAKDRQLTPTNGFSLFGSSFFLKFPLLIFCHLHLRFSRNFSWKDKFDPSCKTKVATMFIRMNP
jgi:hypothetical protein